MTTTYECTKCQAIFVIAGIDMPEDEVCEYYGSPIVEKG